MEWFSPVEWNKLFIPDTPILEILVRGTVIYLSLFCLLRLILKRQAGTIGISDLLVIVLIAEAASNGLMGDYKSLPDAVILAATLIFWNFALEWLGFHFPVIERFVHPPPLLLIKNGRFQRNNMRRELMTEDDLMSALREKGVSTIKQVKKAFLEGDGKISVIKNSNLD